MDNRGMTMDNRGMTKRALFASFASLYFFFHFLFDRKNKSNKYALKTARLS